MPITISSQPSNCDTTFGQPATFGVTASGGTLSYQWYHNEVSINGATDATYYIPSAYYAQQGRYFVHISMTGAIADSNTATLTVHECSIPAGTIKQRATNTIAAGLVDIAPDTSGQYSPSIGWVLDSKTNLPVGNRVIMEI